MNNWICLLLGLCLVAQEAGRCRCDYLPWMRYFDSDNDEESAIRERDQKQLDSLQESGVECTAEFFAKYRRLTNAVSNGYYFEYDHSLRQTEQWLAQCKDTFVQDFNQRVAGLGTADTEKLWSLASCVEAANKNPMTLPMQFIWPNHWGDSAETVGVLTFMGEEGAFDDSPREKLTRSAFDGKYNEIVVGLCQRVAEKLEPTAEIFRMYSEMRDEWLKGVDESVFELADASDLCGRVLARDDDEKQHSYTAYEELFKAEQLPGDSRWETKREDFEKRVDAFLAASEQTTNADRCNAQFFSKFDSFVSDSIIYLQAEEQRSLRVKRGKLFNECSKQVFRGELAKSIATLTPDEARKAVALGDICYPIGITRYYPTDDEIIGRGILMFMQQLDPSLKTRKLSPEEVKDKYEQLVGKWVTSVTRKLEPTAALFRNHLNDKYVTSVYVVDDQVISWAHRWNFLTKMPGDLFYVLRAYEQFKKDKRCKGLSRFMCGSA